MSKRHIERLKNAIIAVLALLAILLFFAASYYGGGLHFMDEKFPLRGAESNEGQSGGVTAAAVPVSVLVCTYEGRWGAVSDAAAVQDIYARCTPALREALGTAEEPTRLTEKQWQQQLAGQGVYFAFDYPVDLSTLALWLGTEFAFEGGAESLLMVSGEEGEVTLCVNDGEETLAYVTQARYPESELSDVEPNDSQFAFMLSDKVFEKAAPYAVVPAETENYFPTLTASNPFSDTEIKEDVLEYMGVNPYADFSVFEDGVLYSGTDFRLQLAPDGTLSFKIYSPGALSLPSAPESADGYAGAVEAARFLAEKTMGAYCGAAKLYCTGVEVSEGVYTVSFAYYVNGIRVYIGGEDAAKITVSNGAITQAEMKFRNYSESGGTSYVLSPRYAAAADPDSSLKLIYTESGGTAAVNWQG